MNQKHIIIEGIDIGEAIAARGSITIYGSTITMGSYNGRSVYTVLGTDHFDLGNAIQAANNAYRAAHRVEAVNIAKRTSVKVGKATAKVVIKTTGTAIGVVGLVANVIGAGFYNLGKTINQTTKKF